MNRRTVPPCPTDEEALAALRTLRAWLGGGVAAGVVYTQDSLPREVTSRDAFLRRHRARVRSRVPGWRRSGKVRSVTVEAWAADVAAESERPRARRLSLVPTGGDHDVDVARALGIRPRRTA